MDIGIGAGTEALRSEAGGGIGESGFERLVGICGNNIGLGALISGLIGLGVIRDCERARTCKGAC